MTGDVAEYILTLKAINKQNIKINDYLKMVVTCRRCKWPNEITGKQYEFIRLLAKVSEEQIEDNKNMLKILDKVIDGIKDPELKQELRYEKDEPESEAVAALRALYPLDDKNSSS